MSILRLATESLYSRKTQVISWATQSLDSPASNASVASAAWPTANKAFFFPFLVQTPVYVNKFWWVNGATPDNTKNIDLGVWAANDNDPSTGTLLFSTGSTTQGVTANTLFSAAPSGGAKMLGVGVYWCGMTADDVAVQIFAATTANYFHAAAGHKEKASATVPLATSMATITLETYVAAFLPLFGLAVDSQTVY